MVVTISGLPGSGTSTLSARAATALGIEHVDGGSVWRAMAREKGLGVREFSALSEREPEHDLALDQRLADRVRRGDVLLEARLAGWIAANDKIDSLRVWVGCDEDERARRVAEREDLPLDVALEQNRAREASERRRYLGYYGIDLDDRSVYSLQLDSTATEPAELVAAVVAAARSLTGGDSRI